MWVCVIEASQREEVERYSALMNSKVDGIKRREMQASDQRPVQRGAASKRPESRGQTRRPITETNRKQLQSLQNKADQQRTRPPGIQHAGSGGVASVAVCSGAHGAGEGGGEGGEAVRSRVPEGRGLHLRRLPLEEVTQ